MPPTATPEEKESTLSKLIRAASTVDTENTGKKGKQSGLVWGLISAGIIALLIAMMGFAAVWARRKAARLQHEINVRDERALQVKERAKMVEREKERELLTAEAAELEAEIEKLRAKRVAAAIKAKNFEAEVRAITSWSDVEVVSG